MAIRRGEAYSLNRLSSGLLPKQNDRLTTAYSKIITLCKRSNAQATCPLTTKLLHAALLRLSLIKKFQSELTFVGSDSSFNVKGVIECSATMSDFLCNHYMEYHRSGWFSTLIMMDGVNDVGRCRVASRSNLKIVVQGSDLPP